MLRYDTRRSEFAVATPSERVLYVAILTLAVAGALIMLAGDTDGRDRWMAGALVATISVFFVPNRRWRMAVGMAAMGLMIVAFTVR